jgi:hypothetical protein
MNGGVVFDGNGDDEIMNKAQVMGTGKKEVSRRERQGKVGDGMANVRTKGENFYR